MKKFLLITIHEVAIQVRK